MLERQVQRDPHREPQLFVLDRGAHPKVPHDVDQHHLGVDHGVPPANAVPGASAKGQIRVRVPQACPFRQEPLRIELVRGGAPNVLALVEAAEIHKEHCSRGEAVSVQLDWG